MKKQVLISDLPLVSLTLPFSSRLRGQGAAEALHGKRIGARLLRRAAPAVREQIVGLKQFGECIGHVRCLKTRKIPLKAATAMFSPVAELFGIPFDFIRLQSSSVLRPLIQVSQLHQISKSRKRSLSSPN
jgi:hypothetical protein